MQIFYLTLKPILSSTLMLSLLLTPLLAVDILAQEPDCIYAESTPSVNSARAAFRAARLKCAEQELKELLALNNISREIQADAHLLLASVYFIDEPDANRRRLKVKKELVAMYMADRRWHGQPEIVSSEFRALLNNAREMAQWRFENSPDLIEKYSSDSLLTAAKIKSAADIVSYDSSKPWYTKWWAFGSGVGLVVVAVQLLGSDQVSDPPPTPVDTLPDFPSTP